MRSPHLKENLPIALWLLLAVFPKVIFSEAFDPTATTIQILGLQPTDAWMDGVYTLNLSNRVYSGADGNVTLHRDGPNWRLAYKQKPSYCTIYTEPTDLSTLSDAACATFYCWDYSTQLHSTVPGRIVTEASQEASQEIKIMSYNIYYQSFDNITKKTAILNILGDARTACYDFIGLQEATPTQMTAIRTSLDKYKYREIYRVRDASETADGEGNPIFYRTGAWTLSSSGTFWLSATPDVAGSVWTTVEEGDRRLQQHPRIVTWGVFVRDADQKRVVVYNTQFPYRSAASNLRIESAELLSRKVTEKMSQPNTKVIVVGDFNTLNHGSESPAVTHLTSAGLKDAIGNVDTYNGCTSLRRKLDYILVPVEFTGQCTTIRNSISQVECDGAEISGYPSDHFPFKVTLSSSSDQSTGLCSQGQ